MLGFCIRLCLQFVYIFIYRNDSQVEMGYDSHLVLRSKDSAALNILNPVQCIVYYEHSKKTAYGYKPWGEVGYLHDFSCCEYNTCHC